MGTRPNGGSSADTDAIFSPIRTANAFEQMLASRASVAVAGKLGKGLNDRVRGLMAS